MVVGLFDVGLRVGLTLATAFLFGIVLLAYLRSRTPRMLLISLGFAVFLFHALITIPELFSEVYQVGLGENLHLLVHLTALVLILLGILKD